MMKFLTLYVLIERVRTSSHRVTQKNRTHKGQKDDGHYPFPSWPLPRPLPRRDGECSPRYPYKKDVGFALSLISIENSSNALWTLYAGGVLWDRNCAQMRSVTSVSSVRKKISFVKDKTPHTTPQCSFSHRKTQKNRTHRVSQRH